MKILFVTSEFADFAKAGGLADVSAALPRALRRRGVDVRILMPGYDAVLEGLSDIRVVATLPRRAGIDPCLLATGLTQDGLTMLVLLAPSLYQREGTAYGPPGGGDWPDNDLRFARLSLAAAEVAKGVPGLGWTPDLVHLQDWPSALAAGYLRWDGVEVPTVLTVHNLAHQGLYPADRRGTLAIPDEAFATDGVEFHGQLSFMKAGLFYANHVTAVSPTYAVEITGERHGAGLHGLTSGIAAQGRLTGIANGIGDEWDPEQDTHIGLPYGVDDPSPKAWIKERVGTSLCLTPSQGPLFGIVSRLVYQKGFDLVAAIAGHIVGRGGQIAILGIGDTGTEDMLRAVVRHHRDDVAMLNGFNEPMAHRIMAASDFYLMPSRFEPCGLSQMHAQRYGALPVAHATGGLVDTVQDGRTGFLFSDFSPEGLIAAVDRAFDIYDEPATLARMRREAMTRPCDWGNAATRYIDIYSTLTGQRPLRVADAPRGAASGLSLRVASLMTFL